MNKKEKTALPQLRFLQYKDSPAWGVKGFGKLIVPVKDRAGTKKYILMSVTSGVGLMPQIEKFGREIAGNAYNSYYVIKRNDFAYNKSATKQFPEGYISMLTEYEEAALPNSIFTCFRIVDEGCIPQFFNHLFHNNYHGSWLRKYIEVGARAHGSLSVDPQHLWNMPVALPRIEEQQKIADCLSSLDDLISAEDKKLEDLKAHKKGLMQKLFPAEGKTVPEWRFPEFRDSGEWGENTIGKAIETITDYVAAGSFADIRDKVNYLSTPDFAQLVRTIDIKNNFRNGNFVFVDESAFNFLWRVNLSTDAIIMPNIGANIGEVYLLLASNLPYDNNVLGPNAILLRSESNNTVYMFFLLCSDYFQESLRTIIGASGQPKFNKTDLKLISIRIASLPEQQKIADCLSSVDDLISEQAKKIEALKQHKKGLMQGLFPSIEEVGE
jgi:type I restriction enzyme S subunit